MASDQFREDPGRLHQTVAVSREHSRVERLPQLGQRRPGVRNGQLSSLVSQGRGGLLREDQVSVKIVRQALKQCELGAFGSPYAGPAVYPEYPLHFLAMTNTWSENVAPRKSRDPIGRPRRFCHG